MISANRKKSENALLFVSALFFATNEPGAKKAGIEGTSQLLERLSQAKKTGKQGQTREGSLLRYIKTLSKTREQRLTNLQVFPQCNPHSGTKQEVVCLCHYILHSATPLSLPPLHLSLEPTHSFPFHLVHPSCFLAFSPHDSNHKPFTQLAQFSPRREKDRCAVSHALETRGVL